MVRNATNERATKNWGGQTSIILTVRKISALRRIRACGRPFVRTLYIPRAGTRNRWFESILLARISIDARFPGRCDRNSGHRTCRFQPSIRCLPGPRGHALQSVPLHGLSRETAPAQPAEDARSLPLSRVSLTVPLPSRAPAGVGRRRASRGGPGTGVPPMVGRGKEPAWGPAGLAAAKARRQRPRAAAMAATSAGSERRPSGRRQ